MPDYFHFIVLPFVVGLLDDVSAEIWCGKAFDFDRPKELCHGDVCCGYECCGLTHMGFIGVIIGCVLGGFLLIICTTVLCCCFVFKKTFGGSRTFGGGRFARPMATTVAGGQIHTGVVQPPPMGGPTGMGPVQHPPPAQPGQYGQAGYTPVPNYGQPAYPSAQPQYGQPVNPSANVQYGQPVYPPQQQTQQHYQQGPAQNYENKPVPPQTDAPPSYDEVQPSAPPKE